MRKPTTLEDLRQSAEPAWLWDGARGRIVWANAAGVAAFDGQSVFDLVDRPFDVYEPGVARIVALTKSLPWGGAEQALLHFPSVGLTTPLACLCSVHALADGRAGLLVVAEKQKPAMTQAPDVLAGQTLAKLPVALLFVSGDGALLHCNDAARALIVVEKATSLAELIASDVRARELLSRLKDANVASSVERVEGPLGVRDIRLTLSVAQADTVCIVMEDITDRRALEMNLQSPSSREITAAAPATSKSQAFEILAQSLQDTIRQQTADIAKAAPRPRPVASQPTAPQHPNPPPSSPQAPQAKSGDTNVPNAVRVSLEATGEAIIIAKGNGIVFATNKVADILQYPSTNDLLADESLLVQLKNLKQPCSSTTITVHSGLTVDTTVSRAAIPWHSGPAEQYVIQRAAKPEPFKPSADTTPATIPAQRTVAAAPPPSPVVPQPVAAIPESPKDSREAIATEELKAILDVASDGIITLDRDGRILSFSAGAESIFGMAISEVVDRPLADLLSPESRRSLRDYIAALNGPGLASVFNDGREVAAIVRQGGSVPLFLTIGRLQSPRSRAAYCAVVRDITPWKRTEKDLREAKDAAETASRQKSEFLARISHELRTPLNAIMGFSEVMRLERFGEIKNEKYRGYVHDIHASGTHLLALIDDLLDLSKVEAGKLELNFTAVSLHDSADHAIRILQQESTLARVVVRKAFPANLPRIVADLRSLRQILLNLISNAIKYTDAGGQVILSAAAEKDGGLTLRIKDTGIGMNEAQLHDALQPFSRVATANRERQGTGLGLPLTKALVEANRAKFTISSEPGKGTLVEVLFPVTRVLAE